MRRFFSPLLLSAALLSCASPSALGQAAPDLSLSAARLVFSGVRTSTSDPQTLSLTNRAASSLSVTALSIDGPDAAAFLLSPPPGLPLTLESGRTLNIALKFSPQGRVGVLKATLRLEVQGRAPLTVNLSGLSTQGEQGESEPPLALVVQALGYSTDVGGDQLILGTDRPLLGQELSAPLFRKVGNGQVVLRPVARYSPDDLLTFGFFTLRGGQPVLNPLGTLARHQDQTLNPRLDGASIGAGPTSISFDPAGEPFGIYAAPNSYSPTGDYSLDRLNTGPTRHAVRVYPLIAEGGAVLPGYLLAFEAATNGDYQDYVFVLSGAEPLPETP